MILRPTRNGGFTLVELLVVIAILGILIAISLPAYTMAINHAKIAKCSSNLRQIGIGMLAFAGDNNGNLPESGKAITYGSMDDPPGPTGTGGSGQYGWTQQLDSYLGTSQYNTAIYQCPDSSFNSKTANNAQYAYFNGAHAGYAQAGAFAPVNLFKIHNPSQMIMGGDIAVAGDFGVADCDKDDYTQDPAFNGNIGTIPIHGGSVNIVFADGHVENLKKFDPTTMTTVYQGPGSQYTYLYMGP